MFKFFFKMQAVFVQGLSGVSEHQEVIKCL